MAIPAPEDTYDKVLLAAEELFGEQGFAGTSLQAIADRVGVTKAALYYHFRTKDELLDALLRPALNDLDRVLEVAESRRGTAARQRLLFEGFVDFLIRYRTLAVILDRDVAIGRHPAIQPRLSSIGTRVSEVLDDVGDSVEYRVSTAVVMGGIYAAVAACPDLPDEELGRVLRAVVRKLLGPRRRAPGPTTSV